MRIDQAHLHRLSIPLKGPFHTAIGGIDTREVALIEVDVGEVSGWGEAAPYPGQDESMDELVAGASTGDASVTLASAIELAIVDVTTRAAGTSVAMDLGVDRDTVPTSIAVGLGGDPVETVRRAVVLGVGRFKVKVAPGYVDQVAMICDAFPDVVVGLDGNGSFDIDTVHELDTLQSQPITYFEQPCDPADVDTLMALRTLLDVPVFADESVRSAGDASNILASPHVDGVVVKPGRLGFKGSLATIAEADRLGKRWRASGLLETGVGRAYTDLLAALPSAFVSDVAPADWFLERDVVVSRFDLGEVSVPTGPGIGVEPDPEILNRYRVDRIDVTDLVRRQGDRGPG
jgi:O-succinylbenzoate synthase